MAEIVGGTLEVGCDDNDQVVINHPDLKPDENGVGHIVFSVQQARALADLLRKKAADAENSIYLKAEAERIKNLPPVDRSKRTLTDGSPVTDDHRELLASGQQRGLTTMGLALAETYARDPNFYSGTFCCTCGKHFDLDQFVWEGTDEQLGS